MNTQKLIDALEGFSDAIKDVVADLRDNADHGGPDAAEAAPQGYEVEEVDLDGLTPDSDVDVNIGNLWRLVNGARYMVRMAREGKIPTIDQRGPLDRALKALKAEVPALRKGGIGRLVRG